MPEATLSRLRDVADMTGAGGYAAVAHDTEPTADTITTRTHTTITAIIRASTDSAITTIIVSVMGITTDTIERRQDAGSIAKCPGILGRCAVREDAARPGATRNGAQAQWRR